NGSAEIGLRIAWTGVLSDIGEAIDRRRVIRVQRALRDVDDSSGAVHPASRRRQVDAGVCLPIPVACPCALDLRAPERYAADRRDRFESFLAAICLIDDLAHLDDFEEALARSAQAYRSGIRAGSRAV